MGKSVEDTKFCKLSEKIVNDDPKTFAKLVSKPKYVCRKCFRVSADKANLCRPEKIKDLKDN